MIRTSQFENSQKTRSGSSPNIADSSHHYHLLCAPLIYVCCYIYCHQRCQIIFFKSVRSDVKIRQNPPSRIDQIRQKSARNWDDLRPFFTLRVVFVGGLVLILPYLRSGPGQSCFLYSLHTIFLFWKYFAQNYFLLTIFFKQEKVRKKLFFA
jgi:hypothetical protein